MRDDDPSIQALPVLITVGHAQVASVLRYVDAVLGWQPVSRDTASPLHARLQLTDDPSQIVTGTPAIVLVDDDGVSAAMAQQFVASTAVASCLWPSERDRLPAIARAVLATTSRDPSMTGMTVGGSSGGVGTTTVALTLGGLAAWQGRNTLVMVNDASSRARPVAAAALADPNLWDQATQLAGFTNCRMVRVIDDGPVSPVRDGRIAHTVHDRGVSYDVDVLVIRPDRAGLYALSHTIASVVMVTGDGVVSASQLKKAAGSRHLVPVHWSSRVAHAVAHERVPAGVPGSWLQPFGRTVRAGQ